jgi:DNA polymerase (family 10)
LLEFAGEPKFKVKAYEQAANIVETLGDGLAPLVEQDRLRELQGIGATLSAQIHELWNTGSSALLNRLRSEQPEGAVELARIEGLTPRRVRALHDALGIRSVEELRDACMAGRVRGVPGFGKKTEEKLLAAVERWLARDPNAPTLVLLESALELAGQLQRELERVMDRVELAGALRRGEEVVSEIEFVVVGDMERALDQLSALRHIVRVDREQRVAHSSAGLQVRLSGAKAASFGNSLVLATGNAQHVAELRARAAERGFGVGQLAPDGVHPRGDTTESPPLERFPDERALYGALGLSFVPPELRAGSGELERAAHEDFADLLELADVQGMVHCHTTYSDGKNSIREMALAAHALGMKYITITDHSPSANYAGGVTIDRLKQQWDEIAQVQEQVPIRILRGTESDILADGSLDFPDAILEQFDVVIASIHARHRMDRESMTRRISNALSLPLFKIWGHALGRILNHRDPIDCDVLGILDTLTRAPGAIEVNADPHRLDLPPAWIPAARERGIPFVVSVDAHSTRGLEVLRYGVTMARRGGLRRSEVLNTSSAEAFAARVRPRP